MITGETRVLYVTVSFPSQLETCLWRCANALDSNRSLRPKRLLRYLSLCIQHV